MAIVDVLENILLPADFSEISTYIPKYIHKYV